MSWGLARGYKRQRSSDEYHHHHPRARRFLKFISVLDALKMHAFSLTSLICLLSVVRSLEAVSLVSTPGFRVRTRSDGSGSPGVIDATNGQLEIANKVIAPDGFSRMLVCFFSNLFHF